MSWMPWHPGILAVLLGKVHEVAKAPLFHGYVNASANISITETEIIVTMGRRANSPLFLAAGTAERREPIPWLGHRILVIRVAGMRDRTSK